MVPLPSTRVQPVRGGPEDVESDRAYKDRTGYDCVYTELKQVARKHASGVAGQRTELKHWRQKWQT